MASPLATAWLDKFFQTGYALLTRAGVALPKRNTLNFAAGATVVDNPITGATDVTMVGIAAPPNLEMFRGNIVSANGSSTKLPIGGAYFNPANFAAYSSFSAKFVFRAILQTTNTGNAANIDIYDQNGITNAGTPITLAGSALSYSATTNPTVVSVELTAIESFLGLAAGILTPRLWIQTPTVGQDAICYGAWIEPSFS